MMNRPRIVFMGTPEFACAILQTLLDGGYQVVAAVSQPDRPVGRKMILKKTPVHELADRFQIPVLQPEHLRRDYQAVLAAKPDLIVTCAYGQMVPDEVLAAPALGCINVHASLLPKYRGGAPIQHAIMAGEKVTGVTIMQMVHAMDAGEMYARAEVAIGPDETVDELTPRLMQAGSKLLQEQLPAYLEGTLKGTAQDEALVTVARNISKEEEQIHFAAEPLPQLYDHVRGLTSWPGSYGMLAGKRIKFFRTRKREEACSEAPGTVLGFQDHAMQIACRGGVLEVYELQPEGKGRMDADSFHNGLGRSEIGKVFD
jgi:methionyl-tRNA formyltransferase